MFQKEIKLIRPAHKNQVEQAIKDKGLEVLEFSWTEENSNYDPGYLTISKILHVKSGSYFTFDFYGPDGKWSSRSPGVSSAKEDKSFSTWEEQKIYALEWLDCLAEDLGIQVKSTKNTNEQLDFNEMNKSLERNTVQIFVSHSSADKSIATRVVTLLCSSLGINRSQIRCTSVPGCKLAAGADAPNQLLQEIKESKVFIGLITSNSVESMYVLFELGARWAVGKYFAPVLGPDASIDLLKGPLETRHALRTILRTDMQQLVDEIAYELGVPLQPAQSYDDDLQNLINAKCGVRADNA